MMTKKTLITVIGAVVAVAIVGLLAYVRRPPYPKNWDSIRIGMAASEAQRCEPRLSSEMRDVKRIDQFSVDLGDRAWTLVIGIDPETNVECISKMYVFKSCGFWNKTIFEQRNQ